MKLEAVKENGYAIEYIENPTEEICLEAVRNYGLAIEYIENPTEEIEWEAIKNNGGAIEYIENPTEEIKVEAVKNYVYAIEYMKEVNNKICFNAILNMLKSFCNINYDDEKLKIKNAIFFISNLNLSFTLDNYYIDDAEIYLKEFSQDNRILVIPMKIFNKIKEYLIDFNEGNCFIFDESISLKTVKKAAISNNEIMYIKYKDDEEVPDKFNPLLNKIITQNDLLIKEGI